MRLSMTTMVYAPVYDHHGNAIDTQKCSFCRVLLQMKRYVEGKRKELN